MLKTSSLIAHDSKKAEMIAFAILNREELRSDHLIATASTDKLPREKVGLEVECFSPGSKGGDAQIGSSVTEKQLDAVIFMINPLGKHPHFPYIHTLLRLCNAHNTPLATMSKLMLDTNSSKPGGRTKIRHITDTNAETYLHTNTN
jgi:methylglyoxal synthase